MDRKIRALGALPLLAALAGPAQALELDRPKVRLDPDCSVTLTLRLQTDAQVDPGQVRVETAAPPTYRRLEHAYPPWVRSAQLERVVEEGEHRVRVRSAEPLPTHASMLILALAHGYETPVFHEEELPPCDSTGVTREVVWGDTLLGIALEHARSLGVDSATLMLAIQLHNREAFIYDNINLVRAGAKLYIPGQAEIARLNLPRQWLIDEIRFQNAEWRQWRAQKTRPRTSARLKQQRLQLVPIEPPAEPDVPAAPAVPEKPAPAPERPTPAESTEPAAAPAPETAPAPAAAEPRPETEMLELESEGLEPLTDRLDAEETPPAREIPWSGVLTTVGALILAYLLVLLVRRLLQARQIRRSLGDIPDRRLRATSALNLARAHVEAKEYGQARPLIRLVLADGTFAEREEAKKLKSRIRTLS